MEWKEMPTVTTVFKCFQCGDGEEWGDCEGAAVRAMKEVT